MSSWSERAKLIMKKMGITHEMLANEVGITRGAITHYFTGRRQPPLKQLEKIAIILKTTPAWLQYGIDESALTKKKIENKNPSAQLPLLSWDDLTNLMHPENIQASTHKEYLPDFFTNKIDWYALEVDGDSMTKPQGQTESFYEGDMIIIDPKKEAVHGNFVIALLKRSKEATFKQYVIDGGIEYLKPLNPQYPILKIDESTHICGVVVKKIVSFL